MISCGSEQEKLTVYIPDTCTDTLQYEIYLPEEEGLNIFYDLCVTDSFCAFLLPNESQQSFYSNYSTQ